MPSHEVKNLQEIIAPLAPETDIVSTNFSNLVKPGDNYGSTLFGIDIVLKTKTLHAVGKMLPQNEYVQKLFNCNKTFVNEVGFYETILPVLQKFQKEHKVQDVINLAPDFYGARINLDTSKSKLPDENGILLIENLRSNNYEIGDRKIGFNLEQTKAILSKMVELHATFHAFKMQKPAEFNKEIGRFFEEFPIYARSTDDGNEEIAVVKALLDLLEKDEYCLQNMERIRKVLNDSVELNCVKNVQMLQSTNFNGFAHNDLWTNNILLKNNESQIDVKFIDYQIYDDASVVKDFIFFLFTSVELAVLEHHIDTFLSYYYDNFLEWLKKFKCDITIYNYENFIDEIKFVIKTTEFFHIILMLRPMYAIDKTTKEVENLNKEDFVLKEDFIDPSYKKRAHFVCEEMIRRNWI